MVFQVSHDYSAKLHSWTSYMFVLCDHISHITKYLFPVCYIVFKDGDACFHAFLIVHDHFVSIRVICHISPCHNIYKISILLTVSGLLWRKISVICIHLQRCYLHLRLFCTKNDVTLSSKPRSIYPFREDRKLLWFPTVFLHSIRCNNMFYFMFFMCFVKCA